jgi:hypothetical protein
MDEDLLMNRALDRMIGGIADGLVVERGPDPRSPLVRCAWPSRPSAYVSWIVAGASRDAA